MYNPYGPQANIDKLRKQREEIDNLINNFQQMPQQPINNIINSQAPVQQNQNMAEVKVLNSGEDVMNIAIISKTIFIGEEEIALKSPDGSVEKWKVKKIYPIDKKDEKINQLEEEIKKLKEMINSEHTKSNKSVQSSTEQDGVSDIATKSKPKANDK